jgi:phosphoglycolate phosphatase
VRFATPVLAVFDLDGTLVDSAEHCARLMNDMLGERGGALRLTGAQTRRHMAAGGARMIEALFGEACGDPDLEIADFRARYRQVPMDDACLYPFVREGLALLAAWGARLSVCSNKPQDLCEKTLADVGLLDRFDSVVGSAPPAQLKPHPALFRMAFERAGARNARACMIGDTDVDRDLAEAVGAPFILAAWGYGEGDIGPVRADDFAAVPPLFAQTMESLA